MVLRHQTCLQQDEKSVYDCGLRFSPKEREEKKPHPFVPRCRGMASKQIYGVAGRPKRRPNNCGTDRPADMPRSSRKGIYKSTLYLWGTKTSKARNKWWKDSGPNGPQGQPFAPLPLSPTSSTTAGLPLFCKEGLGERWQVYKRSESGSKSRVEARRREPPISTLLPPGSV